MGRPPLPIGTYGDIKKVDRDGKIYARAYFRHQDGRTKPYEAQGASFAAAKRALKEKLQQWMEAEEKEKIGPRTRVRVAADLHLDRLRRKADAGDYSPSTARLYESVWRNHLRPRVGELQLGEVTVQRVDQVLIDISDAVGRETARTARVVLRAIMAIAVTYRAVPYNAVRDADKVPAPHRKPPKALTPDQVADILVELSKNKKARDRDLPDLCLWMLATSERLGNALAAAWERIDLPTAEADVGPNIIRVKGKGLVIRDADVSTKTRSRIIGLPQTAVRMLRARWTVHGAGPTGLVFPNARDTGPLDPSNVSHWIREAMDDIGYPWITAHVFRKTVASSLDAARLSPREISDRLGHSKINVTQDSYIRRRALSEDVTAAIEALLTTPAKERERDATVTELRPRGQDAG